MNDHEAEYIHSSTINDDLSLAIEPYRQPSLSERLSIGANKPSEVVLAELINADAVDKPSKKTKRLLNIRRRREIAEDSAERRTSGFMMRMLANMAILFAIRNRPAKDQRAQVEIENAELSRLDRLWRRYTRRAMQIYHH